jgi:alkylhydroperoxidase family enzyme
VSRIEPAPFATWLPVEAGRDVWDLVPGAHEHLRALYASLWEAGVDPALLELCRIRIATLVGSETDLQVRDPRAGLDPEKVAALTSWPTSDRFTEGDRAALAFAEQYVLDAHGVTDAQTEELHRLFTPPQLAALTTAIATFDALARVRTILADPSGAAASVGVALT